MRRLALGIVVLGIAAAGFLAASVAAGGLQRLGVAADTTTSTTETTETATTETTETTQTSPPATSPKPKPKPKPKPPARLPKRVTIGGVHVGGLTPKAALSAVKIAFSSPLVITVDDIRTSVSPRKLGAKAYAENAVARATAARSGQAVDLTVTVNGDAVRAWVARLAKARNREVRDATVVLQKLRPKIVEERDGLTVRREATVAVVAKALRENRRGPIPAAVSKVRAKVSADSISSIIVIRRGSNQLRYYQGVRLVRTFPVATGQSVFPTPLGKFEIIQMSRNPWWYPPPSPWAQGLNPVPPGPGNPLGTRWMGISAPAVGIHGTPDAASLGYSASHGCIRMAIPSAEWLFEHVKVGTPVIIVPV